MSVLSAKKYSVPLRHKDPHIVCEKKTKTDISMELWTENHYIPTTIVDINMIFAKMITA